MENGNREPATVTIEQLFGAESKGSRVWVFVDFNVHFDRGSYVERRTAHSWTKPKNLFEVSPSLEEKDATNLRRRVWKQRTIEQKLEQPSTGC